MVFAAFLVAILVYTGLAIFLVKEECSDGAFAWLLMGWIPILFFLKFLVDFYLKVG